MPAFRSEYSNDNNDINNNCNNNNDKHLLNSYDIMNCQNLGLSHLLKPKAGADNTNTRLDNSGYHAKTEFNECFIIIFLKQSAKESSQKFETTTRTRGLETRQTLNSA